VGGLIILTNGRTLLNALDIQGDPQVALLATLAVVWAAALLFAVRSVYAGGGRFASAPAD
jgi:hypothetical protein